MRGSSVYENETESTAEAVVPPPPSWFVLLTMFEYSIVSIDMRVIKDRAFRSVSH